jgi:hypothetical protein
MIIHFIALLSVVVGSIIGAIIFKVFIYRPDETPTELRENPIYDMESQLPVSTGSYGFFEFDIDGDLNIVNARNIKG